MRRDSLPERIAVVAADLESLAVDALVVPASASLEGGAGVAAAVHRAAGPKLLAEYCAIGGCPPGEVRVTGGYELAARWVIHAVVPRWRGGRAGEAALLASCYTEALRMAERNALESLAFAALAAGGGGFPLEAAAPVAVRSVAAWLVSHELPHRVAFACPREAVALALRRALAAFGIERAREGSAAAGRARI
jgi:O-acetyl-ADP-ribose deacetylase (regulator of RNase III)